MHHGGRRAEQQNLSEHRAAFELIARDHCHFALGASVDGGSGTTSLLEKVDGFGGDVAMSGGCGVRRPP